MESWISLTFFLTFRDKNLRGDQPRESCQLWKQMGRRVLALLGTTLSLNLGDSSVPWSSEPKWRRGEELLSAHLMTLTAASTPHVSESQAPKFTLSVMTKQNDKSGRKARVLRASAGSSMCFKVRCVWKTWCFYHSGHKGYITSERTKHQFISPSGYSVFLSTA